jgi:hypothetical protein
MRYKKNIVLMIIFFTIFAVVNMMVIPSQCAWAQKRITIGGGSPGAIYYLFAAAAARVFSKHYPEFMVNSASVGGSAENAVLLGKEEQEFGIMSNDTAYHAYNGIEEFSGKACLNLRAVTGGYAYGMNLIVLEDSPIQSYRDIVGKRACVGPAGGSYHFHVGRIMSLGYGIDISKAITQVHMNYNQAPDALRDGVVQAIFNPAGIIPETRGGGTYNLAVQRKVRFISIDEEAIKKIQAKYPYFLKVILEPGFFPNQSKPYMLLAVPAIVGTHKNVSDDVVYKFVSAIYDNKTELLQMFPGGKDFVDESKIKSLSIPLHPGAIKYYKEKEIELPKF